MAKLTNKEPFPLGRCPRRPPEDDRRPPQPRTSAPLPPETQSAQCQAADALGCDAFRAAKAKPNMRLSSPLYARVRQARHPFPDPDPAFLLLVYEPCRDGWSAAPCGRRGCPGTTPRPSSSSPPRPHRSGRCADERTATIIVVRLWYGRKRDGGVSGEAKFWAGVGAWGPT